jgi:hypothetical protein
VHGALSAPRETAWRPRLGASGIQPGPSMGRAVYILACARAARRITNTPDRRIMFRGLLRVFKILFTLRCPRLATIRLTGAVDNDALVGVSAGVNASNSPKPLRWLMRLGRTVRGCCSSLTSVKGSLQAAGNACQKGGHQSGRGVALVVLPTHLTARSHYRDVDVDP